MRREILVSASAHEQWVALLEDDSLVEIMFDRPDQGRLVGDIYLGRVDAVIPGIQAAFVDIGTEKAAFLHVSDLVYEDDGEDENGGRRKRRKDFPPIQQNLQKGQELLVQVTKEPISTKGPRVTAQVSLPGRFMVYIPSSKHVGVSRKIDDRGERSRLRSMARDIVPAGRAGVIIRTVGEEVTKDTLKHEFKRLDGIWSKIQKKAKNAKAPALIHAEAKLISGVIRDQFSDKFDAIRIDSEDVYSQIMQYVGEVAPELKDRIHRYEGEIPLFDEYGVREGMQEAFSRRVNMKSGGYLIIEPTEALVSVDVNTGRFTGKKDAEKTILKTNMEAAREVARQLRLRDIGGIIVVDFIDMDEQSNRDRVLHELRSHLGRDRARTKAFEVSHLGLVEMTRQRVRPSIFNSLTAECEHCGGAGRVYTPATVVRRIERSLVRARGKEKKLVIRLHPDVAIEVLEQEPDFLERLRARTDVELSFRDDPLLREDEFHLLSGRSETEVTEKYVVQ